jgi:hypothetical protein
MSVETTLQFLLCINGLGSFISFANFHFYADDLHIYLSRDELDLSGIISALNDDLAENGMSLNPRKSQANLIFNSNVGLVMAHLFLETEKIPWWDVVTDLEVVIDGCLYFGRQVTKV